MPRQEFPTRIRVAALSRCGGLCEGCRAILKPGRFAFDHQNPDGLTGNPTLENCQVLCDPCHMDKTGRDTTSIARAKRREALHVGAKLSPRRKLQSAGFGKVEPQRSATRPIQRRDL